LADEAIERAQDSARLIPAPIGRGEGPSATPTGGRDPAEAPGLSDTNFPNELYEVRRFESFWTIAEQAVDDDSEEHLVASYWQALIDMNRDQLISPDDPDLLMPGQVIELPPR